MSRSASSAAATSRATRVSIDLPIEPDRRPVNLRVPGRSRRRRTLQPFPLSPIRFRNGTLSRHVLLSSQPGLLRMAAGLDYLQAYPYGCTEQRISLARAELALHKFRDTLMLGGKLDRLDQDVKDTITYVSKATNDSGLVLVLAGLRALCLSHRLVGAVPGGGPRCRFCDRRRAADQANRRSPPVLALRQHQPDLRIEYAERVWALTALAEAGKADDAYAAELARKTQWLDLEALAQVTEALGRSPSTDPKTLSDLMSKTWAGIVIRLYQGKEIYGRVADQCRGGRPADRPPRKPAPSRRCCMPWRPAATSLRSSCW